MIIVGFTSKTSKILPNVFCKNFKHVAPIVVNGNKLIMYQFEKIGQVKIITLQWRDIQILNAHGWVFFYLPEHAIQRFKNKHYVSCVQMTKDLIGIHNRCIQRPDALYNFLCT